MISCLESQNTSKVFTTLASIAASAILVRTIYIFHRRIFSSNLKSSCRLSNRKTIVIEEYKEDDSLNKEFRAIDTYLVTEFSSSVRKLRVRKDWDLKKLVTNLEMNEEMVDVFMNVEATWRFILKHIEKEKLDPMRFEYHMKSYELTFDKKHEEMVMNSYLPYIMERSRVSIEENKVLKLYPVNFECGVSEYTFDFDHPITFENLAIDSELKTSVLDDLNAFINAKQCYTAAGKAWKRGYLLYGPSGTGKSSLIAAIANHLNYDIYDLDISEFDRDPGYLEGLAPEIPSQTVVVVEDIDFTVTKKVENRELEDEAEIVGEKQVTVSDILNQLRLCPGDGQLIVFTTDHIDMIDPEVLTPAGLIDMQIHMPYCTISAFKQLAFNHFGISHHEVFEEIESLVKEVEVTLAQVSGELMKSRDAEVSLQGLSRFLWSKIAERDNKQQQCKRPFHHNRQKLKLYTHSQVKTL